MNETTENGLMAEAVFAAEQEIPRARLKQWREDGSLEPERHWKKCGQAFMLTVEGQGRVFELAGLPEPEAKPKVEGVEVHKCRAGVLARILRAHRVDNGQNVSVRLTGPGVFASQFRFHDRLTVTPTETEGLFEYAGRRPMRVRI